MIFAILTAAILFCMLLSFLFSGSETGLLALSRERLLADLSNNVADAKRLRHFAENLPLFLGFVLFGNALANVAATFFSVRLWDAIFGDAYFGFYLVSFSLFFLLSGEILPKIFFKSFSPKLIYASSKILRFLYFFFRPMVQVILLIGKIFERGFFFMDKDSQSKLTPSALSLSDFHDIISEGEEEGVFSKDERLFMKNLSLLSRTKAVEVMQPLVDLFMVYKAQDLESVLEEVKRLKIVFIPVYEGRIDKIIGFVDMLEVFRSTRRVKTARDFMSHAIYVPENVSVASLYQRFSIFKNRLVVLVDEYGGCSGIVTVENIMQKTLTPHFSERASGSEHVIKIDEKSFLMDAALDIDRFNEIMKLNIDKKGFETLGGFLLYLSGKVPEIGERCYYGKLVFKITKADKTGVDEVKVSMLHG